jgi:hypothetical protein
VTESTRSLERNISVRFLLRKALQPGALLVIGKNPDKTIIRSENFRRRAIQMRVSQQNPGHDLEGSLAEHQFQMPDHIVLRVRIAVYLHALRLVVIEMAAEARKQS